MRRTFVFQSTLHLLAEELLQAFIAPPTHPEVQASAPPYCGMQETCTVIVGWNTPRQRTL